MNKYLESQYKRLATARVKENVYIGNLASQADKGQLETLGRKAVVNNKY